MNRILVILSCFFFSCLSFAQVSPESTNQMLKTFEFYKIEGTQWKQLSAADFTDPHSLYYKTMQGLVSLRQASADMPITKFHPSSLADKPDQYFSHRIKIVLFETNEHSETCRYSGIVAYVDNTEGAYIHLCPYANEFNSNLIMTSTLVHEARHQDDDGHPHSLCKRGAYQGQDVPYGACDENFESQGSYGVETSYLIQVNRSPNQPESVRQEARGQAVDSLMERFNQVPFNIKAQVLLKDRDGTLSYLNNEDLLPVTHLKDSQQVSLRYGELALFDSDNGSAQSFMYQFDMSGPTASAYRDVLSAQERKLVMDVLYSSSPEGYGCLLLPHSLKCVREKESVEISLPTIQPHHFAKAQTTQTISVKLQSDYLIDTNGRMYRLPAAWKDFKSINEDWLLNHTAHSEMQQFGTRTDGMLLGLDKSGLLNTYSDQDNTWSVVPSLSKVHFVQILSPFYWSAELLAL
jgi:uncharacterized protein YfbU (UPF0304 family)